MNDEVCWHPVAGGCFKPAASHFKRGGKMIAVCSEHWSEYYDELGWEAIG